MNKTQSVDLFLPRSINIIHGTIIAVVLTYIADMMVSVFEPDIIVFLLIILPVKTIILSGLYGALIDIIKGDQLYVTKNNFFKNAKRYWWVCLLFNQILPVTLFILSLLTQNAYVELYPSILAHFKIIILAGLIITITLMKDSSHTIAVTAGASFWAKVLNIGSLLGLYIASIFMFYFLQALQSAGEWMLNIGILAAIYIEYLIFTCLALFVIGPATHANDTPNKKELIIVSPMTTGLVSRLIYIIKDIHPAVLGILYALTPSEYKVHVITNVPFRQQFYKSNCLVAITCYTPNCYEAYKIAKEYRKRGSKVIMGGTHVSSLPDEALAFCDSVVIGEVESVWPDIIKDYETNSLKSKYFAHSLQEWSASWHEQMLNVPVDIMQNSLETTRGCPFSCNFCTSPNLVGTSIRKMPVEDVVAMIKKIKTKHRHIYFNDANIFSNPQYAKELFRALIPLNIRWTSHVTLNIAKDDEALDLAQKSGCAHLAIGLETSDTETAQTLGGKFRMIGKYREYVKKIKSRGIHVVALFIVGFKNDNFLTYLKILCFSLLLMPYLRTMSKLTPFPGTELYYDLLTQNKLINQNWRKYDLTHFVYRNNFWKVV